MTTDYNRQKIIKKFNWRQRVWSRSL